MDVGWSPFTGAQAWAETYHLRHADRGRELVKVWHIVTRGRGLPQRHVTKTVSRDCCKKVTGYANKVNDAVGANSVCKMSQSQFFGLYYSLVGERAKEEFF